MFDSFCKIIIIIVLGNDSSISFKRISDIEMNVQNWFLIVIILSEYFKKGLNFHGKFKKKKQILLLKY